MTSNLPYILRGSPFLRPDVPRKLSEQSWMYNSGVIVGAVFVSLILLALTIACFCRYYESFRKFFRRNIEIKVKRDIRDYKVRAA